MAGAYQSGDGTIGGLLRQIQDDKSLNPLQINPQSQPGSPIRGLVADPVFQPEAPDSSRVFATRPELTPSLNAAAPPTPEAIPPIGSNPVVAAGAPVPPPVADVPIEGDQSAPSNPSPSSSGTPQQRSAPSAVPSPAPAPKASTPSVLGLATKLAPSVAPKTNTQSSKVSTVQKPTPTPTPNKTNAATVAGRVATGLGLIPQLLGIGSRIFTQVGASTKSLNKGLEGFFRPNVQA